jgi:hypothetical protein
MATGYRCQPEPGSEGEGVGWRVDDALTNLSAYALTLDRECHRLGDRLLELAKTESEAAERRAVLQERDELEAELRAFRCAVKALREQVARGPERRG